MESTTNLLRDTFVWVLNHPIIQRVAEESLSKYVFDPLLKWVGDQLQPTRENDTMLALQAYYDQSRDEVNRRGEGQEIGGGERITEGNSPCETKWEGEETQTQPSRTLEGRFREIDLRLEATQKRLDAMVIVDEHEHVGGVIRAGDEMKREEQTRQEAERRGVEDERKRVEEEARETEPRKARCGNKKVVVQAKKRKRVDNRENMVGGRVILAVRERGVKKSDKSGIGKREDGDGKKHKLEDGGKAEQGARRDEAGKERLAEEASQVGKKRRIKDEKGETEVEVVRDEDNKMVEEARLVEEEKKTDDEKKGLTEKAIQFEERRKDDENGGTKEEAEKGVVEAERQAEGKGTIADEKQKTEEETSRAENGGNNVEEARQVEGKRKVKEQKGVGGEAREVEERKSVQEEAENSRVTEEAKTAREEEAQIKGKAREEGERRVEHEIMKRAEEEGIIEQHERLITDTKNQTKTKLETEILERRSILAEVPRWPSKGQYLLAKKNTQYDPNKFNFAVAGSSGSGKSSLINVFLGLHSSHPNAAPTGITETTLEIKRYPDPGDHPPHSSFVWFDIPGAGTSNIPSKQYFNEQGLFIFDFIIVVVDIRFTEVELAILENCRMLGIPSFIVRSKADQHIWNMMREKRGSGGEGDDDLRRNCREELRAKTCLNVERELRKAGLPAQKVYIVSASPEFQKEYPARCIGSEHPRDETLERRRCFMDETELINDLLLAARNRRCGAIAKEINPGQEETHQEMAADCLSRSLLPAVIMSLKQQEGSANGMEPTNDRPSTPRHIYDPKAPVFVPTHLGGSNPHGQRYQGGSMSSQPQRSFQRNLPPGDYETPPRTPRTPNPVVEHPIAKNPHGTGNVEQEVLVATQYQPHPSQHSRIGTWAGHSPSRYRAIEGGGGIGENEVRQDGEKRPRRPGSRSEGAGSTTPFSENQYLSSAESARILDQVVESARKTPFSIAMIRDIDTEILRTQLLVLSSTRVHAIQVQSVLEPLFKLRNVRSCICTGKTDIYIDKCKINSGKHVISGTPGRVSQLIQRGFLPTADIKVLVINVDSGLVIGDEMYAIHRSLRPGAHIIGASMMAQGVL